MDPQSTPTPPTPKPWKLAKQKLSDMTSFIEENATQGSLVRIEIIRRNAYNTLRRFKAKSFEEIMEKAARKKLKLKEEREP